MQSHEKEGESGGTLYIVATPIGNLEDITLRALRILKEVDYIASEDTRRTKKLLNHFDFHVPLISYYREKEKKKAEELLRILHNGGNVALVTDAGTPCISDPGAILVEKARSNGISVVAIPGASSVTAALSVSGFSISDFLFLGFPPSKRNQRLLFLKSLIDSPHLLVFFESPRRLLDFLTDCIEAFGGDRNIFLSREQTKLHEESITGSLVSVREELSHRNKILGEVVVIIDGNREGKVISQEDIVKEVRRCRNNEMMTLKDSVSHTCKMLGVSRSKVYKIALAIWD